MTLIRERYDKLFSTPLLRYSLPDHADLNASLLAWANTERSGSSGAAKSNRGGWHSDGNLFKNSAAPIQTLRSHALEAIADAHKAINAKADLNSLEMKLFGWMNANPQGAFNSPHTHPGAHWSGVYYIAQPDTDDPDSGMIEFIDARTDLPHWRILDAAPFRLKKKLRPQPGDLILFPSYLVHWVYPNTSPHERVSVAFNVTLNKKTT